MCYKVHCHKKRLARERKWQKPNSITNEFRWFLIRLALDPSLSLILLVDVRTSFNCNFFTIGSCSICKLNESKTIDLITFNKNPFGEALRKQAKEFGNSPNWIEACRWSRGWWILFSFWGQTSMFLSFCRPGPGSGVPEKQLVVQIHHVPTAVDTVDNEVLWNGDVCTWTEKCQNGVAQRICNMRSHRSTFVVGFLFENFVMQ